MPIGFGWVNKENTDGLILDGFQSTLLFNINEKNCEEKFQEYLSDPDNKKWEQIASSGKEFTMNNFSNDEAVKQLVTLFESMKK